MTPSRPITDTIIDIENIQSSLHSLRVDFLERIDEYEDWLTNIINELRKGVTTT